MKISRDRDSREIFLFLAFSCFPCCGIIWWCVGPSLWRCGLPSPSPLPLSPRPLASDWPMTVYLFLPTYYSSLFMLSSLMLIFSGDYFRLYNRVPHLSIDQPLTDNVAVAYVPENDLDLLKRLNYSFEFPIFPRYQILIEHFLASRSWIILLWQRRSSCKFAPEGVLWPARCNIRPYCSSILPTFEIIL